MVLQVQVCRCGGVIACMMAFVSVFIHDDVDGVKLSTLFVTYSSLRASIISINDTIIHF